MAHNHENSGLNPDIATDNQILIISDLKYEGEAAHKNSDNLGAETIK